MPKTPSGTRIWPTLMPLGRRLTPVISPTGSGIAASCSQPSATVSMICGVSFKRSSKGCGQAGLACGLAKSRALAACSAAPASRRRRARARKAASLAAVGAAASVAAAVRAAWPMPAIKAGMSGGLDVEDSGGGMGRDCPPASAQPARPAARRRAAPAPYNAVPVTQALRMRRPHWADSLPEPATAWRASTPYQVRVASIHG